MRALVFALAMALAGTAAAESQQWGGAAGIFESSGTHTLGNGQFLYLDTDLDSYIYALTDDLVRFYGGGVLAFQYTATVIRAYLNLSIEDGALLALGSDTDYSLYYATGVGLKLRSTDVDGGGTDGDLLNVADGTDDAVFSGQVTSSDTGSLGWSLQSSANQACTTTCTTAAVFGFDNGTGVLVGPADATADDCICAGGS